MMERQIGYMVRLIDDLLDASRITSGTIRLNREPTTLHALVNSAIDANRTALAQKQIELHIELPDDPGNVDVDPTRFVQIISNLLNNAAKFTDAGGSVYLRARIEGDELLLSVTDTGIGIPADLRPRMFELFMQGQRGSAQGGLGIGLALAKRLTEMHGGTLDVVFLDIGMPGLDGYETCSRIRDEVKRGVMIVALTGFGQEQDLEKATRAGFDAHLTKPAEPRKVADLLSAVPGRAH